MNDKGADKFFSEEQEFAENANDGSGSYGEQLGSASLNYLENNEGVNNHYIVSEEVNQTSH